MIASETTADDVGEYTELLRHALSEKTPFGRQRAQYLLRQLRHQWPERGPKAKGWGDFCASMGLSVRTALNMTRYEPACDSDNVMRGSRWVPLSGLAYASHFGDEIVLVRPSGMRSPDTGDEYFWFARTNYKTGIEASQRKPIAAGMLGWFMRVAGWDPDLIEWTQLETAPTGWQPLISDNMELVQRILFQRIAA